MPEQLNPNHLIYKMSQDIALLKESLEDNQDQIAILENTNEKSYLHVLRLKDMLIEYATKNSGK